MRGLFGVWLQRLALGLAVWPFSRLAPTSGSGPRSLAFFASGSSLWLWASKLGLVRVWLQPLALGPEIWPFSRLAPASCSSRWEILKIKLQLNLTLKLKLKFDFFKFPNVTVYVLLWYLDENLLRLRTKI